MSIQDITVSLAVEVTIINPYIKVHQWFKFTVNNIKISILHHLLFGNIRNLTYITLTRKLEYLIMKYVYIQSCNQYYERLVINVSDCSQFERLPSHNIAPSKLKLLSSAISWTASHGCVKVGCAFPFTFQLIYESKWFVFVLILLQKF